MAAYTNKDGTVTYTLIHHFSMVSPVNLVKPQVSDDDDDRTPEDIISMPIGNEHWQDKKGHMKVDIDVERNIISIKNSKNYFMKIYPPRISQNIWEL